VSLATTTRPLPHSRLGTMLYSYREHFALLIALGFLANIGRAQQVAASTFEATTPGGGGGVVSISEIASASSASAPGQITVVASSTSLAAVVPTVSATSVAVSISTGDSQPSSTDVAGHSASTSLATSSALEVLSSEPSTSSSLGESSQVALSSSTARFASSATTGGLSKASSTLGPSGLSTPVSSTPISGSPSSTPTSTTLTNSTNSNGSVKSGLSPGAAAGIGVGATIVFLVLVGGGIWFGLRYRRRGKEVERLRASVVGELGVADRDGGVGRAERVERERKRVLELESKEMRHEVQGEGEPRWELEGGPGRG
jgi:hypothetical protein